MADRDFKGVWIPREIWLDDRLNALEKIILAEIDSLDCGENHCWKSNENLAEFCQCSVRKVTDAVSKLIALGYVEVAAFDGRTRKLRSCIAFSARQPRKICEADTQILPPSNTYSNTKSNKHIDSADIEGNTYIEKDTNTGGNVRAKRFEPPTVDQVDAYIREKGYSVSAERFVDYYESNGWMVGRNRMKDWKAAVRTWAGKDKGAGGYSKLDREKNRVPEKYGGGEIL